MVSFGEKAKIKKARNLNKGRSYVITTGPFFCYFSFWITLFSKISKKLALFDSYYWPFYKPHEKINEVLLISAIKVSIWKVFIEFSWHGEKPTFATLVTLSSISCHTVVMQFSGTRWDFLSKFLSLDYYTTLEGVGCSEKCASSRNYDLFGGSAVFSQSAIRLKKLTKIITIH